ncbi:hypothetical protein [Pelagerythrobacter marensis]|uniref:Uncharacterized protein n=1 Tax=Pelagerythrobacter marensis TaxID=543877 RepID=A0A0G3XAJ8_9SPHN|nr:hypothetical protein [Pelagerythrobacter marensis]AKM08227.1 hypothetical protein AM2010_2167 [Pelagerythrobacter marensis]
MFEGKIVPAVVDSAADGGSLTIPGWADLVARLAAANELRRAVSRQSLHRTGNFECFGNREDGVAGTREPIVNPDDLAHGKGAGGIVPPTANNVRTGDREMQ